MSKKRHTTFYVSEKLNQLMKYFIDLEEIPKTLFVKRAIREYLNGNLQVDNRILITKRSDPEYIKRDVCIAVYIECEQMELLKQIAKEKGCKMSQLLFQALVLYTSSLAIQLPSSSPDK